MTAYRQTTIAAAGASLLAAAPLAGVFRTYSWFMYGLGVVLMVLGMALLTRSLRFPVWSQIAAMLGGLMLLLSWLFGGSTTLLGVIPTPDTLVRFVRLIGLAGGDARELAAPVPDTDGLLFTVALSIGLIAVLVDLVAVGLRQPALAGLPMLAIYSVPVAVLTKNVSWISFVLAAAGFLWLLVADHITRVRGWGRRFADDGRDVDAWERSPLAAAGRRLGLVGIVAAVLIPLAVPGMTGGLLERLISGSGISSGPGGTDTSSVNPFAVLDSNLKSPEVRSLLRVRTEDPSPGYLRFAVADQLTDRGAFPARAQSSRLASDPLPMPPADREDAVDREENRARVQVTGLRQPFLPVYPGTHKVALSGDDRWFYDDDTAMVWARTNTQRNQSYQLDYVRYDYTPDLLRGAGDPNLDDPRLQRNVQVPQNPYVGELVGRLTRGKQNSYDRVMGIYNHFSAKNGFTYSTQVKPGNSGSPVVDFLQNKQGYCQQYAVAMTWMVRAAGIPARVVIGFTQGVRENGGFTVTTRNAHAWVEVFFEGFGWVPFDPTPASSVANPIQLPWAPNPYVPSTTSPTASPTVDPSGSAAPAPTRTERRDPGQESAAGGKTDPPARWPYWLLGGLLVAALLAAPAVRRAALRRRRWRIAERAGQPDGAIAAAHAAWDELLDTLVDLDIDHQSSDTPRSLAARLTRARPPLVEQRVAEVETLARAMERASYSRQPLPSDGLGQAVRLATAELRSVTTGLARWRAAVFPASVMRSWSTATVDFGERTSATWLQIRAAFLARLPRRRRQLG
ncbi:MAG: transglutaminase TgpA family protein [Micromonosporaceae bacterium]